MNRIIPSAIVLASLATLTGCAYSPGGSGVSNDTFTYVSTAHLPQTVAVVDTRSSEQILVVEIPVGNQLVLSFYNMDDEADQKGTLRWGVMPTGRSYGGLSNVMDVPPASSRRVDVSLRRSPEYTKPLVQTTPADVPKGMSIADSPGTTPKPAPVPVKPLQIEVTSPKDPKVDIPN